MTDNIRYTCSCCGQIHDEWPALAFKSPLAYDVLSEADKKNMAEIDSDFCIVRHPEQTDQFIRATLTQKVIDHCQDLHYGLWVSLSEKSFEDYAENYYENKERTETTYFGWLSNDIPEYEFITSIPTTVYTKEWDLRPEIVPHRNHDHPFVHDYYNGITKEEAERRINAMLNIIEKRDRPVLRPWWKFW